MKFSFIVIGYNQKNIICDAIDSILNQSYEDLEVIYVDDASTDGSADFVKHAYISNEKVRVVCHTENKGSHVARLDGMKEATGDWILFADGDDTYSPDTCTVLSKTIQAHPNVNMIGFGVELIYTGNTDHIDKEELEACFQKPHLGFLSGNKILDIIYLKQEQKWNACFKCFSAELAKYILENTVPDYLIASEDFYLTFVACSAVKGYFGISDQLYKYTIGSGISTTQRLSLDRYKGHLTAAKSIRCTVDYAKKHGLFERYKEIFHQHNRDNIYASYVKLKLLREEEKLIASKLLFDSFGVRNVISQLACDFKQECTEIGNHLNISQLFLHTRKPIKTVGMLYSRIYNGGIERVISLLTPILQNVGYKVVIITDETANERDYPLPDETIRVSLGQIKFDSDIESGYGLRYDALTNCIRKHNIDAVICHHWDGEELFWDMCTIKSTGAACIIHTHGVFISGLNIGRQHAVKSGSVFQHADAMAVLSEVDRYYWAGCNKNIHQVNNPLTFDPKAISCSNQDSHNVIWAGRFVPIQKNIYDILYIFSEVLKSVPDAKLYLLGTGEPDVLKQMHQICSDLKLGESVVFTGYTKDVGAYLQNAAVYLFTSDFEGYSMAFAEALSYGLPIVSYPLPYMTMAQNSKATIQVGWKDIHGAANAVVDLLTNDNLRHEMSNFARAEALSYGEEDLSITWKHIIESLEHHEVPESYVVDKRLLADYQKTVNLAFTQMANRIYQVNAQGMPSGVFFDYRTMSKPKRWLAFLVYDRITLKAIVKFKLRNHPKMLRICKRSWKLLKRIFKRK